MLAESPVDRLACSRSVILMILRENAEKAAVAQQEADEMDRLLFIDHVRSKVDKHLFTRWSIEYMIIDAAMFFALIDLYGLFQVLDVITKRLLIPRKTVILTVFYGLLFQGIIDG